MPCGCSKLHRVAACARLASREVHLHDSQLRGLVEHTHPGLGVELVLARLECKRVGAIGTAERTTVCQFGEQAHWRGHCFEAHRFSFFAQQNIGTDAPARAGEGLCEIIDDRLKGRLRHGAVEDFNGDRRP